ATAAPAIGLPDMASTTCPSIGASNQMLGRKKSSATKASRNQRSQRFRAIRECRGRQASFNRATMRTNRDPVDVSIGEFKYLRTTGLLRCYSVGGCPFTVRSRSLHVASQDM